MSSLKCPTCFRRIGEYVTVLSCVGTCPTESLAKANQFRGWDAYVRRPIQVTAGKGVGACDKCKVPTRQEACAWCLGPIPGMWREAEPTVTCIAMAGARTTGKSLYVGVLKGQLDLWVTEQHRSTLTALGDTERLYEERYRDPLYRERRLLEPTATIQDDETAQRPLIFTYREIGGRTRAIVLRDVAGEDLQELGDRRDKLDFLTRADGVIVLLDPYKVDKIRNVLPGVADPGGELGGDGLRVIEQLLSLLNEGRHGAQTQVPIAVALSKFDVLQKLREVEGTALRKVMARPGSPLRRDPSFRTPYVNHDDMDLLNAEMHSLFTILDGLQLPNLLQERAANYRYFAVSALGAPPEGNAVHAAGIAPFRVLDPLKWILEASA